jgi:hypothetical protein
VALVLAQVLETTSILDAVTNKKIYAAWEKHAQPHWEDLTYSVQMDLCDTGGGQIVKQVPASFPRLPGLIPSCYRTVGDAGITQEYQTAVGLGIGMVFSPILWTVGEGLLKAGVGTYLVAEVVHQLLESQFEFSFGGMEQDVAEWEFGCVRRSASY